MRNKIVLLSVDPGMKGGLYATYFNYNNEMKFADCLEMPIVDGYVDPSPIQDFIIQNRVTHCVIEIQQARSRQRGQLKIGINYGQIIAVAKLCGLPIAEVRPQEWKKYFGLIKATKRECCNAAKDLGIFFPVGKRGKPHDGIAEAGMIGRYAIEKKLFVL